MRLFILLLAIGSMTMTACDPDPDMPADNFDRQQMLSNWADNIIIPAYTNYVAKLDQLLQEKNEFLSGPSVESLDSLRNAWLSAYLAFQHVSMFEIGKAEEVTLRDYTNIYPVDAMTIEEYINSGTYNLELPSTRDEQGFPALDYLLYGAADDDASILQRFRDEQGIQTYLDTLVEKLHDLGSMVLTDWNNGYRDVFVSNDGSEASSSVNKLMNDYVFYYEKALRAGKIGIPAGVFSVTPLADKVEGLYSRAYSKQLFQAALSSVIDFFNGHHFDGNGQGESIHSYLAYLNTITESEPLNELINDQFQQAVVTGDQLNADLYQQVQNDNQLMLQTYDELQKNVVLMKVDMFQALNIKVDYVDADGD